MVRSVGSSVRKGGGRGDSAPERTGRAGTDSRLQVVRVEEGTGSSEEDGGSGWVEKGCFDWECWYMEGLQ